MIQLNKYISLLYLKFFCIILLSLESFFVGIEFVKEQDRLPESANMQILFATYNAMYALNFMLPLALVLAQIIVIVVLVRANEMTAIHAVGYSQYHIVKPLFMTSILITLVHIGLNTTSFAYAKERADSILDKNYFSDSRNNLFVKYGQSYVYFGKVYPVLKKAEMLRVYEINSSDVQRLIKADESYFIDNVWKIANATIVTKPQEVVLGEEGVKIEFAREMRILEGFRPKKLDKSYI
jgi:lipopolysaccharide export system permease protein